MKSSRCTSSPQSRSGIYPKQGSYSPIQRRSTLQRFPTTKPPRPEAIKTMAIRCLSAHRHPYRTPHQQLPKTLWNCLHYDLASPLAPPLSYQARRTSLGYASGQPKSLSLVYTRIGCTKIPVLTRMAGSMRMISGKLDKKTFLFPSQRYNVPSGQFR